MAHADPSMHPHAWRASQNWPPLTRMDILGILVAGLGTAALVLIAVFESVDYHGPFQRFFARLSMFGTLGALVVSLGIGLL